MDRRRALIFFLVMFFLFVAPDPQPSSSLREREHQQQLEKEYQALSLLNTSRYGDLDSAGGRWLPLTGLRKTDGFAWGLLTVVKDKAQEQLRSILRSSSISSPEFLNITDPPLPVYRNVSGKIRGNWVWWKQSETQNHPHLNITSLVLEHDYFTQKFGHNITADHGTLSLQFEEEDGGDLSVDQGSARQIKANMILRSDDSFGETWLIQLFGVHFPASGGIILSTTSEKFAGLPSLPHFALSSATFELSRLLLNQSLADALAGNQNRPGNFFPWSALPHGSSAATLAAPKCEYIVYLQQHPVVINKDLAEDSLLLSIEDELRYPMGAPIPAPPPMMMSAVMFSPDCGFVLKTEDSPEYPPSGGFYLSGPKQEEYSKYAGRLIMIIAAILASQIWLLMRQMKEASTPSTRSRVSFYSIAIMSMGDALFIAFVLLNLYSETSFLLLTATAFLAFFSVSFLGMKFQMEIWIVQAPERREQGRQSSAQAATASQSLPLPVTASRPADTGSTPIILLSDQDGFVEDIPTNRRPAQDGNDTGSDAGAMYTRFYFILFSLLFFSSWALLWPRRLGYIYAYILSFVYLSFWTPQIYRNIMRNCRKALRWEFVVGESSLRLFPLVYFHTIQGNVLFIKPDATVALVLIAWVWIQAWVLASQDLFGPRFFVPNGWAPPAYDYHPVLRDTSTAGSGEDIEPAGTLPIGFLRAEERDIPSQARGGDKQGSKDRKKKIFDCAICMQDIEVPVLVASSSSFAGGGSSIAEGATNLLGRRAYMVTPCRHIFHSTCLESWMRLRLQCPICRESIPPV